MSTVLDSIISGVKEDLAERKKLNPNLESEIKYAPPVKDVERAILKKDISIIAEVKRSSPSKGELAQITDPASLAKEYENAGASVVSVLTEERRFKGSISDFTEVRKSIAIPMLRKDFIVDEYQIYESRVIGADMQLLIVAALTKVQLKDFYQLGTQLGMASLFEVHSLKELETAMSISPKIVGVNARNLKTLEVDAKVFTEILPEIPSNLLKVAESGISKRSEVETLEELGANAILVGETLVRAESPAKAISQLLGHT